MISGTIAKNHQKIDENFKKVFKKGVFSINAAFVRILNKKVSKKGVFLLFFDQKMDIFDTFLDLSSLSVPSLFSKRSKTRFFHVFF